MHICKQRQLYLQNVLKDKGLVGFIVTHNVDLYYYTGSMQSGYLFIPAEGDSLFFVRRSMSRAEEEASAAIWNHWVR